MKRKGAFRKLRAICQRLDEVDLDHDDALFRLSYGKPLPVDQAITHLRRGMQWVRVQLLEGMDLNQWRLAHAFPPDTPIILVWQAGLNWPEIVDALEAHPLPWQPEEEAKNKQIQEQLEMKHKCSKRLVRWKK